MVGRFVSADIKQGNGQGMDPYSYVGNNPETMNDPTGLCPFCVAIPFLAAIGEAVVATAVAIIASPVLTVVLVAVVIVLAVAIVYQAYNAWQASKSQGPQYQPNPKHGKEARTDSQGRPVGAEPANAQDLWSNRESSTSTIWKVPTESDRWVGYDPNTGEIIVFDDTNDGGFHSHVRQWGGKYGLTDDQKNVLSDHGVFRRKSGNLNKSWVKDYWDRVKQAEQDAQNLLQQQEKNQYQQQDWYNKYGGGL